MYKLLLCTRYLLTRYLALASIISVMLGVATLIVVNSVMEGFSTKLKGRMRGLLADVLVETPSQDGFAHLLERMRRVERLVGDKVEAVSPVIETFAVMQFRYNGQSVTRAVRLIGIDPATRSQVGEFAQHLLNPESRNDPAACFQVRGELAERYKSGGDVMSRSDLDEPTPAPPPRVIDQSDERPPIDPPASIEIPVYGVVLGFGIASYRDKDSKAGHMTDVFMIEPGDEIRLATISRDETDGYEGRKGSLRPVVFKCVVTDLFKCGMSEYDSNIIFMDIKDVQRLRTMQDRATGLQIKLKDYDRDAQSVVETLKEPQNFHPGFFIVQTWEGKQGAILAAISIERGILNVLLFLIIAVAGFGILAIFSMIVVEKTRDIGILKALGASNAGVMGVFLSYGLALGIVGAGLGTLMGVGITVYINEIEQFISSQTGQDVFDRSIYYFDAIPTDMKLQHVLFVNLGAILIAVGASVFPALRAALLHPVRALRYE